MNALDLLYIPAAIATAPWWATKKRSGWRARFGHVGEVPPARAGKRRLLLHGVSVGEIAALRHLVPLLTPHVDLVVSASTDTGLARAGELFSASCTVVRYPLDFTWSVERLLAAVKPDGVALVELEVWPNFVAGCRARGIPVCVINGRLSARSFKGYSRLGGWFGSVLKRLEFVAAQDPEYAARFESLGVPPERCFITGSMKWDSARIEDAVAGAAELAESLGVDTGRPLVVAGSTGPCEEALLVGACPQDCQLLCAPRKPERFDEAAAAMPGCVRRSETRGRRGGAKGSRLFLLDSIGELRQAYSLATVVVVGRSFGTLYGSDPIEPIALGKPTLIGPATSDFGSVVAAFEKAGGIVRTSRERVGEDVARLLGDGAMRQGIAERGRGCIRENQGASARHAELLLDMVESGVAR